MKNTKENNIATMELKEIFKVQMNENGKKEINRLGFFAAVVDSKPYAWYEHQTPIVGVGADVDSLYELEEPGNIILMTEEELSEKLESIGIVGGMSMANVSKYTPNGAFFDTL